MDVKKEDDGIQTSKEKVVKKKKSNDDTQTSKEVTVKKEKGEEQDPPAKAKKKSTPKDETPYKASNTSKKRKERMKSADLDAVDSDDEYADGIDTKTMAPKSKKSRDSLLSGE